MPRILDKKVYLKGEEGIDYFKVLKLFTVVQKIAYENEERNEDNSEMYSIRNYLDQLLIMFK